jgi:hypothetical protein
MSKKNIGIYIGVLALLSALLVGAIANTETIKNFFVG